VFFFDTESAWDISPLEYSRLFIDSYLTGDFGEANFVVLGSRYIGGKSRPSISVMSKRHDSNVVPSTAIATILDHQLSLAIYIPAINLKHEFTQSFKTSMTDIYSRQTDEYPPSVDTQLSPLQYQIHPGWSQLFGCMSYS
jgi:hypothetical protein